MTPSELEERIAEIDKVVSSITDILELTYANLCEVNYKYDKLKEDLEFLSEHADDINQIQ